MEGEDGKEGFNVSAMMGKVIDFGLEMNDVIDSY